MFITVSENKLVLCPCMAKTSNELPHHPPPTCQTLKFVNHKQKRLHSLNVIFLRVSILGFLVQRQQTGVVCSGPGKPGAHPPTPATLQKSHGLSFGLASFLEIPGEYELTDKK